MTHRFFKHEQFDFEFQSALGGAAFGCGDIGELLATADRISDGDFESWFTSWKETAGRIERLADACVEQGHSVSARAAYLRAAHYYALALSGVDGISDPDAHLLPTFHAHRRCFAAFASRLDPPAEMISIPYEDTSLPGYFFAPSARSGRRPTLILNNGSDGAITALWPATATGALARGYNALLFDGPGQQSMLFEHGVPFRPDWEAVITPVVDHLLARPDVDAHGIALYGISQGGYWVPRAVAFERRVAAAIADPGVYDVSTPWMERLPAEMRDLLEAGDRERFNQYMEIGMRSASAQDRQTLRWRSKPYGTTSAFDTFRTVRAYTLAGVIEKIRTPLLVTDPDSERFWPGQAQQLYEALLGPKRLVQFKAYEGADRHCEPLARSLLEQRMFDWLDSVLTRPPSSQTGASPST